MNPILSLINNTTAITWEIWPRQDNIPRGSVAENGSYTFVLEQCEAAAETSLSIDGKQLVALRCSSISSAKWQWDIGFHAGQVEVQLYIPGREVLLLEVTTDPDIQKLTRTDFDLMIQEILDDTFSLLSISSFRRSIGKGNGERSPPIARLEYLRSRIDELEKSIHGIQAKPCRRLISVPKNVPWHKASRATGQDIIKSFQVGRILFGPRGTNLLPLPLQGFLPATIRQRNKEISEAITEHVQIATCLRAWGAWLGSAEGQLEKHARDFKPGNDGLNKHKIWVQRCRKMRRRLAVLEQLPIFENVGSTAERMRHTPIFRNVDAYRRFYKVWEEMNRGISAIFSEFLDVPLARTWELYELWSFLRITRACVEILGTTQVNVDSLFSCSNDGAICISTNAVSIIFPEHALYFQRNFGSFWDQPNRTGSYTRTLTPDIVISHQASGSQEDTKFIVLDAKYRISGALSDAMTSCHVYRDGIIACDSNQKINKVVGASYLLSPHICVASEYGNYRTTMIPDRFFMDKYKKEFGVGAISLRPGMTKIEITALTQKILNEFTAM